MAYISCSYDSLPVKFLIGLSVRVGGEPSYAQHCLAVIADHYWLLYFMLPLFLLLCFFVMEDDGEAVILRYKSYFRYFISKWFSLVVISLIFMMTQLSAIALSGAGLPVSGGWAIADGSTTQELFTALSSFFALPAICFAASSAYMLAGLCVTALAAMWTGRFLSRSWAVKSVIFFYLLSVMSMRIEFVRELIADNGLQSSYYFAPQLNRPAPFDNNSDDRRRACMRYCLDSKEALES